MERPAVADPATDRARLNPFTLPPATTSLFLLLMTLALSAAAYTYDAVAGGLTGWESSYRRCVVAADTAAATGPPQRVTDGYLACNSAVDVRRAGVGLGAAALVATAMFVGYRRHPRRLIRRQGLRPLDPVVYPVAAREIARLVDEARLTRPPRFVVNPYRTGPGGRAFGCRPHYHVRLNRGLLHDTSDDGLLALRAVVRHELAHLRNRDVDRTVLALLSGWAFVLVVAVPLLAFVAVRTPALLWPVGWRLAVAVALLWLVRAAVIRAREHHADVRASVAGPDRTDPPFHPQAFPEREPSAGGPLGPARRAWWRLLRLHPTNRDRADVVRRPEALLRAGAVEALAAGVTVGVSLPYLSTITTNLLGGDRLHGLLLASALLGALTVTVVGTGLWRQTLVSLVTGTPLPTGVRPGLALAAGIAGGELVAAPLSDDATWPSILRQFPAQGVLALVLLALGCLLFARWSVASAAAWLPSAAGRTLTPAVRAGQALAALAFGAGLTAWSTGTSVAGTGAPVALPVGVFGSALDPWVLLPLLAAAAYPLTAAVRRGGALRAVRLDRADGAALPRPRIRPAAALLPPALVFVVALAVNEASSGRLLVAAATWLGRELDPGSYQRALLNVYALLGAVALGQLVVAFVAAALGGRSGVGLGPAHALVAAVLTGYALVSVLLTLSFVELCLGAGCGSVYQGVLTIGGAYTLVGVFGLAAAVVAGTLVASAGRLVRWRRARWPQGHPAAPAGARRARRWPRVVVVAVTGLVVLGYVGPVVGLWLSANEFIPGRGGSWVPEQVAAAAPPPAAGTVAAADVCRFAQTAAGRPLLVDQQAITNVEVGRLAAGSDAPGLRAFGQVLYDGTRRGEVRRPGRAQVALTTYCRWLPTGGRPGPDTPPPEAGPTGPVPAPARLAFGQTYAWPDGVTLTLAVPQRVQLQGTWYAVVIASLANGRLGALDVNEFSFRGLVDDRVTPAIVVPDPEYPNAGPTVEAGAVRRLNYAFAVPADAARLRMEVFHRVRDADRPAVVFDGPLGISPSPTPQVSTPPSPTPR
ncbi:M56 family metallopeptidase [Micromonospora harpali]|uniref:M56 family metallopeptidase n=1 Tax=Micromonospora TaxID=1873 RepID=UPI00338E5AA2